MTDRQGLPADRQGLPADRQGLPADEMRRSVILDACVRAEFHTLLLVSVYLLFAGHNQPGGGFAGGLVASCAFFLRYVAGGERAVRKVIRVDPPVVMGVGLLIALVTAFTPLFLGDAFLESAILELHPPGLGLVKVTSVLFFDIGVYVVVLGMALFLLEQFGSADGVAEVEAAAGAEADA